MRPPTKTMVLKALLMQANVARETARTSGDPNLIFMAATLVDETRRALDEVASDQIDRPAEGERTH